MSRFAQDSICLTEVVGNSEMTYDLVSRYVWEIFGNVRELVLT